MCVCGLGTCYRYVYAGDAVFLCEYLYKYTDYQSLTVHIYLNC